jgi:hypothetical protein
MFDEVYTGTCEQGLVIPSGMEVMLSLETITSEYLVGNTIRLTDASGHSIFVHEFLAKRGNITESYYRKCITDA